MNNYREKVLELNYNQGGVCPIAMQHGTAYEVLTCQPCELHHTKLHNYKRYRQQLGDALDDVKNLTLVSRKFHSKYPQWGKAKNEKKAMAYLTA